MFLSTPGTITRASAPTGLSHAFFLYMETLQCLAASFANWEAGGMPQWQGVQLVWEDPGEFQP